MYEPREDSALIAKHIKNYVNKGSIVLDLGTGSGILAREAVKFTDNVIAADINRKLISRLKKENKKIQFIHSDLFSAIKNKFNLILFNPPYLPSSTVKHTEIDGGKNGTLIIEKFLKQAKSYLKPEGKILLICSSLNKDIEKLFTRYSYNFRLIDQEAFFFERLFLYELNL